jgi:ParB family chromosome partitioning protein
MKKNLLNKLSSSVSQQTQAAHDKFERADITLAMKETRANGITETGRGLVAAPMVVAAAADAITLLPIDKVKDHPRNARHLYDPARIDEMATSIARDGQIMPAIVMPSPDEEGGFLMIEGRYRKRALISLGRDTIAVKVIEPLGDLEAYRLSLELNEQRNEQTDLDNALAWKSLQDDGLFKSQEHIAEYLGVGQGTVSKTLSLLDLPAGVLNIMKSSPNQFGLRIGHELRQLSKVMPEPQLEAVAEQVREGKLTVANLEKMRSKGEKDPVTRERSRAYPLQWGSAKMGTLREFDDGRLKIDLSNAPGDLREKIIDAVKKVLAETAPDPAQA